MNKYVYSFNEGSKDMRDILGGKGANLAEMTQIGLPVPKGFIVTTDACNKYYTDGNVISDDIQNQIFTKLHELENATGKTFGSLENPLLLSVRSGAKASMPGMMDTILNLGLNDEIVQNLEQTNARFINDCYRRFIAMYADVVNGYDKSLFEEIITKLKQEKNIQADNDLTKEDMKQIVSEFKNLYHRLSGTDFPQDPKVQLLESVTAVFRSWNNERAIVYRKLNNIPDSWGTAVNVQQMVYGNINDQSGTGVAFTRNPATGENTLYGEYLINAQGEDIVAGVRTPNPISTLKEIMPNIYDQFYKYAKQLEEHYLDMQDMEFTIEDGKLYILQTRNGKRTTQAALKIVLDLVSENKISKKEAILRIEPNSLEQLLHPTFDPKELEEAKIIAKGIAASPGAATGKIYFDTEEILKRKDEKTILVRIETSPDDIKGMHQASGVLTVRGGMTSHAAVVARGMGKCCVSGCETLIVDEKNKTITTSNGDLFKEGDYLSLNGNLGEVYKGEVKTIDPNITGDFENFMNLVSSVDTLQVRANADTKKDAETALRFGAKGIGLVRTEHMFFNEDRILTVQEMILADTLEERQAALDKLQKMQASDFEEIFKVMGSYPVTIRYLDPPLHEFLPKTEAEIKTLAKLLKKNVTDLKNKIVSLKEFNPMMGHRGCRLAITYPEIAIMQTKAIIDAIVNLDKLGITVKPEIMIPLVGDVNELNYLKEIVEQELKSAMETKGIDIAYQIGTMIEVPRACITAGEIAKEAEFFSFGTNDLTQMVYGFSRDDAEKFLSDYYSKKIFNQDPFVTIDQNGVGKLMITAIKLARNIRPNIKLGICGEHGGEASSVEFFTNIGLDYVSCSPYRIPIAKLASAQAAIRNMEN